MPVDFPAIPSIKIYIKDESTHLTGSLKHRLARSLFLYGLCNGAIEQGTTIVEASSGSTAVSEAYFARLLGLPFIAVMPMGTSAAKVAQIEFYGGNCHFVDNPADVYEAAARLARRPADTISTNSRMPPWRPTGEETTTSPSRSTSKWPKNRIPCPWIVVGAGTGGTSATIGRYIRYRGFDTNLCVVDPTQSVFYHHFMHRDSAAIERSKGSGIEGIGRPRVEPSFNPDVIDRMIQVENSASFAAMHFLAEGPAANMADRPARTFTACFSLLGNARIRAGGSIVTLACDPGDRYLTTYYDHDWLGQNGYDIEPTLAQMRRSVFVEVHATSGNPRDSSSGSLLTFIQKLVRIMLLFREAPFQCIDSGSFDCGIAGSGANWSPCLGHSSF